MNTFAKAIRLKLTCSFMFSIRKLGSTASEDLLEPGVFVTSILPTEITVSAKENVGSKATEGNIEYIAPHASFDEVPGPLEENPFQNWREWVVDFLFFSVYTVLLISIIRTSAYIPVLVKSDSSFLPIEGTRGGMIPPFFTAMGIFYPPLLISACIWVLIGIGIYAFFENESNMKKLWCSFSLFSISLFGILITLFSIWGA